MGKEFVKIKVEDKQLVDCTFCKYKTGFSDLAKISKELKRSCNECSEMLRDHIQFSNLTEDQRCLINSIATRIESYIDKIEVIKKEIRK